mgnify:CR=1 FL=1
MMTTAAVERRRIAPQPGPQEIFLSSPADIVVFGGARGPGKTFGLLLEAARHAHVPRFTAVLFRRTHPELVQAGGLWQASTEIYPHLGARQRQSTLEWIFPHGARIKMAHMQHETDAQSWKSSEICYLAFDQAETFAESQFWFMLTCNRSTCGVRPYVRLGCNPVLSDDPVGGWLHGFIAWWLDAGTGYPRRDRAGVLRWFVREDDGLTIDWGDSAAEVAARNPGRQPVSLTFIPGRLEDNPILEARDPDYRQKLMALPKVERERAFGNWFIRATSGSVFDRAWFRIVPAPPAEVSGRARYWDKAGTEGGGDWSVGALLSRTPAGLWTVEDVVRGRWSSGERNRVVRQVAAADGPSVAVWLEQEPGSGGKESAEISVRELAGYVARADRPTGDVLARAQPFAAQAEAGNVRLVAGAWNEAYLREHHDFPDGAHDDQVSASAGAFNKLALELGAGDVEMRSLAGPRRVAPEQLEEEAKRRVAAAQRELEHAVKRRSVYWPGE